MTFFIRRASVFMIPALAMMAGNAIGQTSPQARQDDWARQQAYYQWYYQQYPQAAGGWRGALPMYRGYQTQQIQQPAAWYPPASQVAPIPTAQPQVQQQQPQPQTAVRRPAGRRDAVVQPAQPALAKSTPRPVRKPAEPKQSATSGWLNSYEAACELAQKQGRPMVLLFVHQGCAECDRMDQNLALPGAMDTLACAVKARLEFADHPAVVRQFNVTLTPTFLVLTPSGGEAYREVGALSVDRLKLIQPAIESLVEPSTEEAGN